MTTEIEKQFFECFGIKSLGKMDISQMTISVDDKVVIEGKDLPNNKYNIYPPITDRKLLELIFILNDTFPEVINAYGTNWEYLKNYVLTRYITDHKYINKQQVKALFEDKEQ